MYPAKKRRKLLGNMSNRSILFTSVRERVRVRLYMSGMYAMAFLWRSEDNLECLSFLFILFKAIFSLFVCQ